MVSATSSCSLASHRRCRRTLGRGSRSAMRRSRAATSR